MYIKSVSPTAIPIPILVSIVGYHIQTMGKSKIKKKL